jgi:2,4-dienoyl-CoA reductase-like NADH-dependent reductase (Old Yellow Enzyme family)
MQATSKGHANPQASDAGAPPRAEFLEPFVFPSGRRLANRVALAPMTNGQSHADGRLGEDELRWLMARAHGGFGSVVTCAAHVRADAQGFDGALGVFDDSHVEGLARLAGEMQAAGTACFVQLYHGGTRCPSRLTGVRPVSASEYDLDAPGFERPRALEDSEIETIVNDFAKAAVRCARAGLPGVEIHGANGYLVTQFLSTQSNLRTDRWGGSLENRARFARELVRAVKQATSSAKGPNGEGFLVGLRLSPENAGAQRGLRFDESMQVARWLAEDGLDFFHLSLGDFRKAPTPGEGVTDATPIVTTFRKALPSRVALMTSGGIATAADARETLALGADLLSLGKAGIAHANWPRLACQPDFQPSSFPLDATRLTAEAVSPAFQRLLKLMKLVKD